MAAKTPSTISNQEKLSLARKFKEEGNECHKKQQLKQAIGKYHRALLQLKSVGGGGRSDLGMFMSSETMEEMGYSQKVTAEEKEDLTKLLADCYNNLAACLLKQEEPNYEKILEYCNKVTELDQLNIKANYRKGVAFYHLQKFEEALECFERCESIDSSFSASLIAKHKQQCKEGIRRQDQKLKDAYRGMFNRSSTKTTENSNG